MEEGIWGAMWRECEGGIWRKDERDVKWIKYFLIKKKEAENKVNTTEKIKMPKDLESINLWVIFPCGVSEL